MIAIIIKASELKTYTMMLKLVTYRKNKLHILGTCAQTSFTVVQTCQHDENKSRHAKYVVIALQFK